jgi:hypothetical protein
MKEGDTFDIILTDDSPATARPVKLEEGKPLPENVALIKATRCEAHPDRLHAEVVYSPEPKKSAGEPKRAGAGPARVSNTSFRTGWDQVFGKQKPN